MNYDRQQKSGKEKHIRILPRTQGGYERKAVSLGDYVTALVWERDQKNYETIKDFKHDLIYNRLYSLRLCINYKKSKSLSDSV